jgi:hypothetical protein
MDIMESFVKGGIGNGRDPKYRTDDLSLCTLSISNDDSLIERTTLMNREIRLEFDHRCNKSSLQ